MPVLSWSVFFSSSNSLSNNFPEFCEYCVSRSYYFLLRVVLAKYKKVISLWDSVNTLFYLWWLLFYCMSNLSLHKFLHYTCKHEVSSVEAFCIVLIDIYVLINWTAFNMYFFIASVRLQLLSSYHPHWFPKNDLLAVASYIKSMSSG